MAYNEGETARTMLRIMGVEFDAISFNGSSYQVTRSGHTLNISGRAFCSYIRRKTNESIARERQENAEFWDSLARRTAQLRAEDEAKRLARNEKRRANRLRGKIDA